MVSPIIPIVVVIIVIAGIAYYSTILTQPTVPIVTPEPTEPEVLTCKERILTAWHRGQCAECPTGYTRADCEVKGGMAAEAAQGGLRAHL